MEELRPEGRAPLLPRGGARNRADRETWQLAEWQCRKLIAASQTAWAIGMPFNRFVTIAWGKCGLTPDESVAATGEWINSARDWMRERGRPMPWAWVQETGPRLGAHCHVLIHLPPGLAPILGKRLSRWARNVIETRGGSYQRETLVTKKVQFGDNPEHSPAAYQADLLGRVHYMLKAAPAELEGRLGMTGLGYKPWGESRRTVGKRLGVWQGAGKSRVLPLDPSFP